MVQLVLDTSLGVTQAALFESKKICAHIRMTKGVGQAESLLPLISALFQKAQKNFEDLTEIFVTIGPGVFTGIRIGIAAARAMRLALRIPVYGVSSLQLVRNAEVTSSYIALIDAYKEEVYVQAFDEQGAPQNEPYLLSLTEVSNLLQDTKQVIACPLGVKEKLALMENSKIKFIEELDLARALDIPREKLCDPQPLYIRAPDAKPQIGKGLKRV